MANNKQKRTIFIKITALIILAFFLAGCATVPYRYNQAIEDNRALKLAEQEPQIERGGKNTLVDGLGNYIFAIPGKILLFSWRVDNHKISSETEEKLKQYLLDNGLTNVKVRLNQYTPAAEWRRLWHNHAMHFGWRATFGVITTAFYTIIPGRLFGGDNYNPYTNTINLYSDQKSIALHEAAHAKDFASRRDKGPYAAIRILPLVPLYHEKVATGDTIGYDKDKNLTKDEKKDYKILYPAYMTYLAGEGLRWMQVTYLEAYAITFAATIPGHIIGRIKAAGMRDKDNKYQK